MNRYKDLDVVDRPRPELLDVFFERNAQGQITAFVDRREGHDVQWRRLAPAQ